jgi:DNA repair protein RadB
MCAAVLRNISTGCESIDRILGGGIPVETVTLIYGEAETGKTTLTMQCAVNCARQGRKTLFVDCDGTFSPRKLSQIAGNKFEEIADLIVLTKPTSFQDQIALIDKLSEYVTGSFSLVIIDTVTSLYSVRISESPEKTFELNRELNRHLALLAQNAKTLKIAVVNTSQVRSSFDGAYVSVEPVATRVVKFWADTIFAMKPTEEVGTVAVVLEKAYGKRSSFTVNLRMEERGIHEYTSR